MWQLIFIQLSWGFFSYQTSDDSLVSFQTEASCSTDEFLDQTSFQCRTCGTNQAVDETGYGCKCASGFAGESCSACFQASSNDGEFCQSCASTFSESTSECVCGAREMIAETNIAGDFLTNKTCVECPSFAYIDSASPHECASCPDTLMLGNASCACPSGYTRVPSVLQLESRCISDVDITILGGWFSYGITYDTKAKDDASSTEYTVYSSFVQSHFLSSAVDCINDDDRNSCQMLANLCVAYMYFENSIACEAFLTKWLATSANGLGFSDWKWNLPWLYISDDSILTETAISDEFELYSGDNADQSLLSFALVKYAYNGTYISTESLGTQLQLCSRRQTTMLRFLNFGGKFWNACSLDLTSLVDAETYFYDLYYVSRSGNYYPVPVKILSFQDESGGYPNKKDGGENIDIGGLQLTRRFVLSDDVTSDGGVLLYAKSIFLRVQRQDESKSKIYPPHLVIEYASRKVSDIASNPTSDVSFGAEYSMDLQSFRQAILIIFIVTLIVSLVHWGISVMMYERHAMTKKITPRYLLHLLVMILDLTVGYFFWFMFIASLWVFILYKSETSITWLLPSNHDTFNSSFLSLLHYCLFAKLIHTFYRLVQQIMVDIIFLDWEKPKARQKEKEDNTTPQDVSAWRRLFVANEFNEFQTRMIFQVEWSLLAMVFFLCGCDMRYLATAQSDGSDFDENAAPLFPMFQFTITTVIWLSLACIQLGFAHLITHRYFYDHAYQFIDLCSLANISIFIMDGRYHGWYIHGKSLHQFADCPIEEMNENIEKEKRDLVQRRGLGQSLNDTGVDRDTFEVFINTSFREHYDFQYGDVIGSVFHQYLPKSKRDANHGSNDIPAFNSKLELQPTFHNNVQMNQYPNQVQQGNFQQPNSMSFHQSNPMNFQQSNAMNFQQPNAMNFQQPNAMNFQQPNAMNFQQPNHMSIHRNSQFSQPNQMHHLPQKPQVINVPTHNSGRMNFIPTGATSLGPTHEYSSPILTPQLVMANRNIQIFLKSFFNKDLSTHPWQESKRDGWCADFLRLTPNMDRCDHSIFYDDSWYGFTSNFLTGMEIDLILLYGLTFASVEIAFNSPLAAMFIVSLMHRFIVWFRHYFGEKNLALKALIDDRFLV